MPPSAYRLEDYLPHRAPMILLDEIVSIDLESQRAVCAVTVKEPWTPSYVAIEYMAQTAAVLAGAEANRPGFLLGTRRLTLDLPRFEAGSRYTITATCVFNDGEAGSFDCRILDASGKEVAMAVLNAYRPASLEALDFSAKI